MSGVKVRAINNTTNQLTDLHSDNVSKGLFTVDKNLETVFGTSALVAVEDTAPASGNSGIAAMAVRNDLNAGSVSTDGDFCNLQTDELSNLRVSERNFKSHDSAHSNTDKGILALVVRKDTAGSLVSTDGDNSGLQVDSSGSLRVASSSSVSRSSQSITNDYSGSSFSGSMTASAVSEVIDMDGKKNLVILGKMSASTGSISLEGASTDSNGSYVPMNKSGYVSSFDGVNVLELTVDNVGPRYLRFKNTSGGALGFTSIEVFKSS